MLRFCGNRLPLLLHGCPFASLGVAASSLDITRPMTLTGGIEGPHRMGPLSPGSIQCLQVCKCLS